MDISKIIQDSMEAAVKDVVSGEYTAGFELKDKPTEDLVKQDMLLFNYTHTLLTTYHEALKKQLAEQGIKI